MIYEFNTAVALEQFRKRRAANAKKTRVDNSAAYAGSPMVYYCRFCGDHTETLPECHLSRPITICNPCKILHDHGLIPEVAPANSPLSESDTRWTIKVAADFKAGKYHWPKKSKEKKKTPTKDNQDVAVAGKRLEDIRSGKTRVIRGKELKRKLKAKTKKRSAP